MECYCKKEDEFKNINKRLKAVEVESQNISNDYSTIKKRCDTQCSEIQSLKESQEKFEEKVEKKFDKFELKLEDTLTTFTKKFDEHKEHVSKDSKEHRKAFKSTMLKLTLFTLSVWAASNFGFNHFAKKDYKEFKKDIGSNIKLQIENAELKAEKKYQRKNNANLDSLFVLIKSLEKK